MMRRPPRSPPFPYTTLSRSWAYYTSPSVGGKGLMGGVLVNRLKDPAKNERALAKLQELANGILAEQMKNERSEEHTSELQSRQYLVCRLLLEKKNNITTTAR